MASKSALGVWRIVFSSLVACWLTNAAVGRDTTTRVSVNRDGVEGNGKSRHATLSVNGRFIAFASDATNLVFDDTNGVVDIFTYDRRTGLTERVSVATGGTEGDDVSYRIPAITPDGRFVAFYSLATNLVTDDGNGFADVFVRDRQTGTTSRASISSLRDEGNGNSYDAALSADGRFVAFWSRASNLVAGDTNGFDDVFVHDRQTGVTSRVSVSSSGGEGTGKSRMPSISGNGQFVAFWSDASNLVAHDTNGYADVFVHDMVSGSTVLVSVSVSGEQGNGDSLLPVLSADGNRVAFASAASNLVSSDTNGVLDVFVRDIAAGSICRVSVSSSDQEGNGESKNAFVSPDGQFVGFQSFATNLVADDGNEDCDIFVRGPELTLEVEPTAGVAAGEQLTFTGWNGEPRGPVLLWVEAVDGSNTIPIIVASGRFDDARIWSVSFTVPPGFTGHVVTLRSLGLALSHGASFTNPVKVVFE
ncbi:MAG: hypothetical protein AB1486_33800 [Planctomycetota bacterium]